MAMGVDGKVRVVVSRTFLAAPERVFDAWLDPVQAAKFLFATTNGEIIRCEIDAQVGGEFTIVDRREDEDIEHFGEWVEIERPPSGSGTWRLAFDFSVNQSPVSRVAVEIVPESTGCTITLTHVMDAQWENHAERARQGWAMILDALAKVVG